MSDNMNKELSMEELEAVTGGAAKAGQTMRNIGAKPYIMDIFCSCGTVNHVDVNKSSFKCVGCGKVQAING